MTDSNVKQEFGHVMKHCLSIMLNNQSIDAIMEKSELIDITLDKAKAENKNITNMNIDQQKTEINPLQKTNFSQRRGFAKREIGKSVIKKIIEVIPSKYTNFLSNDLEKIRDSISNTSQDLENQTPDLVKQNLNQIFEDLENPFVNITIEELEIIKTNNKPEINCLFNFEISEIAKQPVAEISIPQLGLEPLMKIKFQTGGNIKFPRVKLTDLNNFDISFREFDATLSIGIKEIKVMEMEIGSEESVIYTISEMNIKHKFA